MSDDISIFKVVGGAVFGIVALIGTGIGGCAAYNQVRVYNSEASGRAVLAEAESSRRVAVLEAQALMDSAKLKAQAEVERAKGVSEANDIIMGKLGGPQNYLAYLQIEAMKDTKGQVIYVPTEANLPITEAGRRIK